MSISTQLEFTSWEIGYKLAWYNLKDDRKTIIKIQAKKDAVNDRFKVKCFTGVEVMKVIYILTK